MNNNYSLKLILLFSCVQKRISPTIISQQHFDFEGFSTYLQGIAGGNGSIDTAKSIVADLKLFFFLTPAM